MKYKFIDELKSDVLFEAYGKTLEEVFSNAAEAVFSVVCQINKVKPKKSKELIVFAKDLPDLMFNWLQELIAFSEVEEMFFSKFEILEIDENHLKAKIYGEPSKPEKGETVVKAVTYYKYDFKKTKTGYKATISLDI